MKNYLAKASLVILLALFSSFVVADDTEIYYQNPETHTNLLFLLDTSNTMRRCRGGLIICAEAERRINVLKNAFGNVIVSAGKRNPDLHVGVGALTGSTSTLISKANRTIFSKTEVGGGRAMYRSSQGGYVLLPVRRLGDDVEDGYQPEHDPSEITRETNPNTARPTTVIRYRIGQQTLDQDVWTGAEGDRNNSEVDDERIIYFPSKRQKNTVTSFIFDEINIPRNANITEAYIEVVPRASFLDRPRKIDYAGNNNSGKLELNMLAYHTNAWMMPGFDEQDIFSRNWIGKDGAISPLDVDSYEPEGEIYNIKHGFHVKSKQDWDARSKSKIPIKGVMQAAVNHPSWCGGNDLALAFRNLGFQFKTAIKVQARKGAGVLEAPKLVIKWEPKADISTDRSCGLITDRVSSFSQNANVTTSGNTLAIENKLLFGATANKQIALHFRNFGLSQGDIIHNATMQIPIYENTSSSDTEPFKFTVSAKKNVSPLLEVKLDGEEEQIVSGEKIGERAENYHKITVTKNARGEILRRKNGSKLPFLCEEKGAVIKRTDCGQLVSEQYFDADGNIEDKGIIGQLNIDVTELAYRALCSLKEGEEEWKPENIASCSGDDLLLVMEDLNQGSFVFGALNQDGKGTPASLSLQVSTENSSLFANKVYDHIKQVVDRLTLTGDLTKPIDTAYFEMSRYLLGGEVYYGNQKTRVATVRRAKSHKDSLQTPGGIKKSGLATSAIDSKYKAGFTPKLGEGKPETCEKNAIIVITDGRAQTDLIRNNKLKKLLTENGAFPFNFSEHVTGDSDNDMTAMCDASGLNMAGQMLDFLHLFNGLEDKAPYACMAAMAMKMKDKDFASVKSGGARTSGISTHFIGFDLDYDNPSFNDIQAGAQPATPNERRMKETLAGMELVTRAGGGRTMNASNQASLEEAIFSIINAVSAENAGLAAPGVTLNSSNRLEHSDELFYGVFTPKTIGVWPGNLKKYKLGVSNGEIVPLAQNGENAIGNNGLFIADTKSFWSETVDGGETHLGGAKEKLVVSENNRINYSRKLFTDASASSPKEELTLIKPEWVESESNLLENSLLGLSDSATNKGAVIEWLLSSWGDPLHSEPKVVGFSEGKQALVISDNNGLLHVIDTENGEELFAFTPAEELKKAGDRNRIERTYAPLLKKDDGYSRHTDTDPENFYGLDSSWTIWRKDENTIYAFGGQRRGGKNYYAIDISTAFDEKPAPTLLWKIKGGETQGFEDLGLTWSEPKLAKVRLNKKDVAVLVFAGGYDRNHDKQDGGNVNEQGAGIYIVKAEDGKLLKKITNNDMNYSMPSTPALADVDGDGYVDHIYVGDMNGQVFRASLDNNYFSEIDKPEQLVKEVKTIAIARNDGSSENRRRFYHPPALALTGNGISELRVVIGSGYQASPLNKKTRESVYSFVDKFNRESPLNLESNEVQDVTNANIYEQMNYESTNPNWKIDLVSLNSGNELKGEKSLSQPVIFDGRVQFTTYTPEWNEAASDVCSSVIGKSKLYYVDLLTGAGLFNNESSESSRYMDIDTMGIPPKPQIVLKDFSGDKGKTFQDYCESVSMVSIVGRDTVTFDDVDMCKMVPASWHESSKERAQDMFDRFLDGR